MKSGLFPLLLFLLLAVGCGDDEGPSAPGGTSPPEPTQYEVSVEMSSIYAQEDCESTPGNPGEFRYTLKITTLDDLENRITIGTIGPDEMVIGDGSILGATSEPVRFLMPREPGASFQVEYWIGEYDGADADFEQHSWVTHIYDRNGEQEWAAGQRAFEDYTEREDGETYGLMKFAVWSKAGCKGYARYIVSWKPYVQDADE